MRPDQKWAEEHGLTLRQFQYAVLDAQRKIMRGETPTEIERAAFDFALHGDQSDEAAAAVPIAQ